MASGKQQRHNWSCKGNRRLFVCCRVGATGCDSRWSRVAFEKKQWGFLPEVFFVVWQRNTTFIHTCVTSVVFPGCTSNKCTRAQQQQQVRAFTPTHSASGQWRDGATLLVWKWACPPYQMGSLAPKWLTPFLPYFSLSNWTGGGPVNHVPSMYLWMRSCNTSADNIFASSWQVACDVRWALQPGGVRAARRSTRRTWTRHPRLPLGLVAAPWILHAENPSSLKRMKRSWRPKCRMSQHKEPKLRPGAAARRCRWLQSYGAGKRCGQAPWWKRGSPKARSPPSREPARTALERTSRPTRPGRWTLLLTKRCWTGTSGDVLADQCHWN